MSMGRRKKVMERKMTEAAWKRRTKGSRGSKGLGIRERSLDWGCRVRGQGQTLLGENGFDGF